MCVHDTKETVFKNKIYPVPRSFIKIHKYHSKRMREEHPNPMLSCLKMILKKVRFVLKISNITEIWKETKCKLIENTTQASLRSVLSLSTPSHRSLAFSWPGVCSISSQRFVNLHTQTCNMQGFHGNWKGDHRLNIASLKVLDYSKVSFSWAWFGSVLDDILCWNDGFRVFHSVVGIYDFLMGTESRGRGASLPPPPPDTARTSSWSNGALQVLSDAISTFLAVTIYYQFQN